MKNKLIEILRSVPITDKTYSEYIETVAERFEKFLSQVDNKILNDNIKLRKKLAIAQSEIVAFLDELGFAIAELKKKYTEGR
jgi:predicted DNA-binding protein (UPF0278 family)